LFDVISRETFLLVSANEATYALTWKICGLFFCAVWETFSGVFTLIASHLHKDISTGGSKGILKQRKGRAFTIY